MKKIIVLEKEYCGFESIFDLERDVLEMWEDHPEIPGEFQGTLRVVCTYIPAEEENVQRSTRRIRH